MKAKHYSIGQIVRGRMLLNHKGEAYKHRGTVSKVLQNVQHTRVKTAFGLAKMFSAATISKLNRRWG